RMGIAHALRRIPRVLRAHLPRTMNTGLSRESSDHCRTDAATAHSDLPEATESTVIETEDAGDPGVSALESGDLMLAEPRTAMITGSGGLLGRFMHARLIDSGWRVVGLPHAQDRKSTRLNSSHG